MTADLFGDDIAGCLRCVLSGNAGAVDDPVGKREREFQGKGADVKDHAAIRETLPYLIVEWVDGRRIYDCIYLMYPVVPVTEFLFADSLKMV